MKVSLFVGWERLNLSGDAAPGPIEDRSIDSPFAVQHCERKVIPWRESGTMSSGYCRKRKSRYSPL